MRAEILCVGTELLLGQIIDTNAAYIAQGLSRAGVDVYRKQTIGDNLERIAEAIRAALSRADILVITGGLGPTNDDMTREAIAVAFDVELEHHEELAIPLREMFARRKIPMSEINLRQAFLPRGATALHNSCGTAPGVHMARDGKMVFAVPGVPREMKAMLDNEIIPILLETLGGERQIIVNRVLRTYGVGESNLAAPIEDILVSSQNPTVAPLLFGQTEVHLRLTAKARDETEAKMLLDEREAQIRARVGQHIFGVDDETMAAVVLRELKSRGQTLSIAESVTGGLLASLLTDIPGSSEALQCGVVSYATDAKHRVLDVPQELINAHGVVSGEVAQAMASGVREISQSDFALSTTGEAGPVSGSGAEVGTVFVGLCERDGDSSQSDTSSTRSFTRHFVGDRVIVKQRAAIWALDILRRHLLNLPPL